MSVQRSENGYILLGIAIGLVIMGIFMAAAVPAWDYVIQREKEAELLWRGRQYVQAIERYQRKYPGAFPPSMDVLVEEKFLRKAYDDPMTRDGEWRILRQNSPELRNLPAPGRPESGRGADRRFRQPEPFGQQGGLGRRPMSEEALGGIVGVASASDQSTIRIPGQKEAEYLQTLGAAEQYNQWLFVFQVAADPTQRPEAPGAGQGGQPGQPGQPGPRAPRGPGGFNAPNPPGSPNPPGARRP